MFFRLISGSDILGLEVFFYVDKFSGITGIYAAAERIVLFSFVIITFFSFRFGNSLTKGYNYFEIGFLYIY